MISLWQMEGQKLIVPIATPRNSKNLDEHLEALFRRLYQEGVRDFFPLGTTGRFYELSDKTSQRVIDTTLRLKEELSTEEDPIRLIMGVIRQTGTGVMKTLNGLEERKEIDGVVLAPGYFEHPWTPDTFKTAMEETSFPITLYDLSNGLGRTIPDQYLTDLLQDERIIGFKDSRNPNERRDLILKRELGHKNLKFYCGDESKVDPNDAGLISGNSNVIGPMALQMLKNMTPKTKADFVAKMEQEGLVGGPSFREVNGAIMNALQQREFRS